MDSWGIWEGKRPLPLVKPAAFVLRVKLLTPTAVAPSRAEPGSVGYDIRADLSRGEYILPAGVRARFSTGIAVAIPEGYYGRVAPRSGLAYKNGINVLGGVVDPSYRGEVFVMLHNTSEYESLTVKQGDRIAQLIIEKCATPEVEVVDSLDETERGAAGFGSTGTN